MRAIYTPGPLFCPPHERDTTALMASFSPAFAIGPEPPVSARILAIWLGLGAIAVVLLAAPSALFDLDRFAVPKELALQVTALGALLLLGLTAVERASLVAAEIPLIAFAGWSALSALFATNRWLGMRALAVTVAGVVLFRAGRRVASQGAGGLLLVGLAFALVLGALTGLAQAYGFETSLLAESRAPGGTLGNRNFLAHLLAIGAPLLLLLVFEAGGRRRAALAATGLGLMLGAIVLTRSRAAWLGIAASGTMIAIGWLVARWGRPGLLPASRIRLALVALAVGVTAALLLPNGLTWRSESPYRDTVRDLTNYQAGSGHGRLVQYRNSLRLVARDPLFGTGPGNWPVVYPLVTTPGDPSFAGRDPMPTNPWPSSDWVAFLTERGLVAVILLLAALAAMGLTAARRLRSDDPREVARALALLGLLTATLITGAFDAVLLLAAPTLVVWTAAGLLVPATGTVTTLPVPVRSRLLPALAAFGLAATARSAGQLGAIRRAGPGWPVERLERAVRLDPGSYRLHLMIAERTGCARGRDHAAAAARLFPYLPAPKRRLAMCGYRLSGSPGHTGPAGPISTGGPPSLPHSLQEPSYTA
jgi:O-antigen ligase